jgi:hypothetical protein
MLVPAAIVAAGLLPVVVLMRRASSQLHPLRVEVGQVARRRSDA